MFANLLANPAKSLISCTNGVFANSVEVGKTVFTFEIK